MIPGKITVKDLFEDLCEKELRHDLFALQTHGVYFWKLLRFHVVMELAQRAGLYDRSHPGIAPPARNRLLDLLKRFATGTLSSPLRDKKLYDVMLFPHQRKVRVDGELKDIYTYWLEDEWTSAGTRFGIVENAFAGRYQRPISDNVYWDEYLSLPVIARYWKKQDYSAPVLTAVSDVKRIAGVELRSLKVLNPEHVNWRIRRFLMRRMYYTRVLQLHDAKQVFLVVAYGLPSLIAAARDLGIEVTEVQHGTITAFHPGYSYPKGVTIPYFPDKLYAWDRFWYEISDLPISEDRVTYTGFRYLQQQVKKYAHVTRDPDRVMFISQGTIGRRLTQLAIAYARKAPDKNVVYRLHPSEARVWMSLYPNLETAVKAHRNLSVELPGNQPLYQSFAQSNFVVGVYSTALIEALSAGCQVVLADLPGVEYFAGLVDSGTVALVRDENQLDAVIRG